MDLLALLQASSVILALIQFTTGDQGYLTCPRPSNQVRNPKFLKIQERLSKHVPCDLKRSNYCNIPGDYYPWHSVRRFVYENQGLIRRMYGEVRQLSVLKMEMDEGDFLETNSIDNLNTKPTVNKNEDRKFSQETISSSSSVTPEDETIQTQQPQEQVSYEETTMTTESPGLTETTTNSEILFFNDALKRSGSGSVSVSSNNDSSSTTSTTSQLDSSSSSESINKTEEIVVQIEEDEIKPVLKAVNACPVKEEVVAPYWANNTRGEILALLNLYPFEQYIHWEKCNHEHKQMFCRDGCRCEQQYRLHRLLAFDPSNECRGIFSDWFRFPSCCVCKCYLTEEEISSHYYRAELVPNNRSPRFLSTDYDEEDSRFLDFYDDDQPDVGGIATNHFFYQEGVVPRK